MEEPTASHSVRKTILVVEDEILIAMELESMLEEAGYEVLGPVMSVAAAFGLLGEHRPHGAVLDVNLRGELVTPVAQVLKADGIPFVLSSACERAKLEGEAAFAGAENIGKPASRERLLAAVEAALKS